MQNQVGQKNGEQKTMRGGHLKKGGWQLMKGGGGRGGRQNVDESSRMEIRTSLEQFIVSPNDGMFLTL